MEATYRHDAVRGPARVIVDVPGLPVTIRVGDLRDEPVGVLVTAPNAQNMFVGAAGPRGTDVLIEVSGKSGEGKSMAAYGNHGSTVIQVGGNLNLGSTTRDPGVLITAAPGCIFSLCQHDSVTVRYNLTEMTIEAAAEMGILERA